MGSDFGHRPIHPAVRFAPGQRLVQGHAVGALKNRGYSCLSIRSIFVTMQISLCIVFHKLFCCMYCIDLYYLLTNSYRWPY